MHFNVFRENSILAKISVFTESILHDVLDSLELKACCYKSVHIYYVIQAITASVLLVTPIVGICNWSMFCCALLYVHSSLQSS